MRQLRSESSYRLAKILARNGGGDRLRCSKSVGDVLCFGKITAIPIMVGGDDHKLNGEAIVLSLNPSPLRTVVHGLAGVSSLGFPWLTEDNLVAAILLEKEMRSNRDVSDGYGNELEDQSNLRPPSLSNRDPE